MKSSNKLWGGRFRSDLAAKTEDFTQSIEVDSRLVAHDIWGSQAHAIMLAYQGIISDVDLQHILTGLHKAETDFRKGTFSLEPEKEDVHLNVEGYLISQAGPEFGGKLHTARSRNDQILADARLYIREQLLQCQGGLSRLCRRFLAIAKAHPDTVMPGYTHTQHAQPISLGFWATAYVSMFLRDCKRLNTAYEIVNVNPLGACALAGTSFPIDRCLTAELLGFDSVQEHALDVISSRDFIAEPLCALAVLMANLSRFSEELVYWTSYEFGMAVLDDAYASGSSIMPQKKNPDLAELIRGRTGRIYGALMDHLTNLKGLPMGYNRDLQEDKPPLWDAFDIVQSCLGILPDILNTLDYQTDRMEALANANFATATELANYLVRECGIAFRECHEIVGGVVGDLVKMDKPFQDWEETQRLLQQRGVTLSIPKLQAILDPKRALRNYQSLGSTSPDEVKRMTGEFEEKLDEIDAQIETRHDAIQAALERTRQIIERVLAGKPIGEVIPD